ncbi:nitrilase-related carbon-nitrogen hydrolase [Kribbella antibiotica]|uniref:nitrilase-related carbon-nitrogen hydrolase n=1 Tax=Kribbella antibiotica TaxID=190195 RepID=UPI00192D88BB|nr:nitrilase-related carbon-nitrogen hydrolase [Kribbella antibiotica]
MRALAILGDLQGPCDENPPLSEASLCRSAPGLDRRTENERIGRKRDRRPRRSLSQAPGQPPSHCKSAATAGNHTPYVIGRIQARPKPSGDTGNRVTVGSRSAEGRQLFRRYREAAIAVPWPETARLADLADELEVDLVAGVIERDGGTLYCTALFFTQAGRHAPQADADGNVLINGGSTIITPLGEIPCRPP